MTSIATLDLTVKNYKCFGAEGAGFEVVKPVNIIIGRNNSGKSALLDLIQYACEPGGIPETHYHAGSKSQITFVSRLTEQDLKGIFRENTSGGDLPDNHWQIGRQLIDAEMIVEIQENNAFTYLECKPSLNDLIGKRVINFENAMASTAKLPFRGRQFRRLSAERNIIPEEANSTLEISQNGNGFTNALAQIITRSYHPSSLVEDRVLQHLNDIFKPDATFLSIRAQQHSDSKWEIFLDEKGQGPVALTHSGSGIKTVLLTIAYFVIIPYIAKAQSLNQFVFAFEELENNVHPALQRRLMNWVAEIANKNDCPVFLTTHSSAVIDLRMLKSCTSFGVAEKLVPVGSRPMCTVEVSWTTWILGQVIYCNRTGSSGLKVHLIGCISIGGSS